MNIIKARNFGSISAKKLKGSKKQISRNGRDSILFQFWDFWTADIKQKFKLSTLLTNMMPCVVTILYLGIQIIIFANAQLGVNGLYGTNHTIGNWENADWLKGPKFHVMFLQVLTLSIFFIIMQRIFFVTKYSDRIDENRVAYIRFNRSIVGFVKLLNDSLTVILINAIIILLMIAIFYIYPYIPKNYPPSSGDFIRKLTSHDVEAIAIIIFCSGIVNFFIMYNVYFLISVLYYHFPKRSLRMIQGAGSVIGLLFTWICIIMIYFVHYHYKIGSFFEHNQFLFFCLPPFNIAFSGLFLYVKTSLYMLILVPPLLVILYYLLTYKYISHSIKRYLLLV